MHNPERYLDVRGQPGPLWLGFETAGTVLGDRRDASSCWSEGGSLVLDPAPLPVPELVLYGPPVLMGRAAPPAGVFVFQVRGNRLSLSPSLARSVAFKQT